MSNPDDEANGKRLIQALQSFGINVNVSKDRLGIHHLTATDGDGQVYRLSGDALYPSTVELAQQIGVEDME